MADVPHLAFPVRVDGSTFATVEQDSFDDVAGCVELVLRTPRGSRIDAPEFGLPDLTFNEGRVDPALVTGALDRWEDRVGQVLTLDPASTIDSTDALVAHVRVQLEGVVGA